MYQGKQIDALRCIQVLLMSRISLEGRFIDLWTGKYPQKPAHPNGREKETKVKGARRCYPTGLFLFFLLLFLSSFIESDLLGYRSSWHDDDGRPQQCVYTYTPLSSTENQHRRSSSSFGTLGFLDTNNSIPWLLERWFTLMYRLYIYRVSLLGTQWRRRRRGIGEHCQCNPTI